MLDSLYIVGYLAIGIIIAKCLEILFPTKPAEIDDTIGTFVLVIIWPIVVVFVGMFGLMCGIKAIVDWLPPRRK